MDEQRLALGTQLVNQAGSALRLAFHQPREIRFKSDINLVTSADEAAEKTLVEGILGPFPSDSVLAEEGSSVAGTSAFRWIIDPLDGTTNFAQGIPHFGVSVALEEAGRLIAGWVLDPMRQELFTAFAGQGARLNGSAIRVGSGDALSQCVCVSGFPYDRRERLEILMGRVQRALRYTRGFRRYGAASLDLAYVAAGRFDLYWEDGLSPWDLAAGVLLVREAGGHVCDLNGDPFDLDRGEVLAGNRMVVRLATQTILAD